MPEVHPMSPNNPQPAVTPAHHPSHRGRRASPPFSKQQACRALRLSLASPSLFPLPQNLTCPHPEPMLLLFDFHHLHRADSQGTALSRQLQEGKKEQKAEKWNSLVNWISDIQCMRCSCSEGAQACPEMLSMEKVPKGAQLCDRVKATRIRTYLIFHLHPSGRIILCHLKNERPLQTSVY